jgi:hypothetical protein
MLGAMSRKAKPSARPSFSKKLRRRAHAKRIPKWRFGQWAGYDYARAVARWRDRAASEALIDRLGGAGTAAAVVKRLGWRIQGVFSADEAAATVQRRRRRRRRNAVLAQEARRRGVFRLKARDFDPSRH